MASYNYVGWLDAIHPLALNLMDLYVHVLHKLIDAAVTKFIMGSLEKVGLGWERG